MHPTSSRPSVRSYESVLQQKKWYVGLPPHVRDLLLDRSCILAIEEGENIFLRGHPYNGVYCVLNGQVRIHASTSSGHLGVLSVIEPSQWFGELGFFDRLPRSHDAQATKDTVLLQLSAGTLDHMLIDHPEVSHHFGVLLSKKMRSIFLGLEAFALLPARTWVARRLSMLAAHHGATAPSTSRNMIPVRQEELAHMLALTRQTVGKALQNLETEGVLRTGYGYVEILDWEALWRMAEMNPPKDLR